MKIFFLILMAIFFSNPTWAQEEDIPLMTEEEPAAEVKPDLQTSTSAEPINSKTAAKIRAEDEAALSAPHDHYTVVPSYRYEKQPALKKILKNGTHLYATTPSPQHYSGGLNIGPYTPLNLQGDVAGITYNNVYGASHPLLIRVNGEWQFFQKAGKFGIQAGLGFFSASGNGRFVTNHQVSDALFTLYAFPVEASLMYHLQFWDRQPIVPFGGVGADYFAFMESRDDKDKISDKIKMGGAAAWHWMAGAQIQLDWLDKEVIWQLDNDYGINHIYLTADIRQVIGLNSTFDFSAMYYEGGILFEF